MEVAENADIGNAVRSCDVDFRYCPYFGTCGGTRGHGAGESDTPELKVRVREQKTLIGMIQQAVLGMARWIIVVIIVLFVLALIGHAVGN